jgi:hypothetical protein
MLADNRGHRHNMIYFGGVLQPKKQADTKYGK